jgi:dienelactone hydrolase
MSTAFRDFVQQQANLLRQGDRPPQSLADWQAHRAELRKRLIASWGGFPPEACELEPRVVGELQRDGYRVEKLLLQTLRGITLTANAYVPHGTGPFPAVLCVHGHWKFAKQHPDVQSRCIGLAKLGFFVLMVDAFGAGERGLEKALGEYHGEMVAATLFPTGLALAGVQVYENMRAIDYLQSRPEVIPGKIGVTGASGGGNQTMYVGAIDDRLQAVVPVCSVGRYQAYLGAACCMCEVTPGALSYTEEGAVLGLIAPRALNVISATQDAFQFSVGQAAQSVAYAKEIYQLYDRPAAIRQTVFESPHAYNQPMREAMYGWMTLHLKGEGDGSPIPEPEHTTEEPETLRCFPGDSRPAEFITLPQFAAGEANRLLQRHSIPSHREHWETQEMNLLMGLSRCMGAFPESADPQAQWMDEEAGLRRVQFTSEPGIELIGRWLPARDNENPTIVLLDFESGAELEKSPWRAACEELGWGIAALNLRATAALAYPSDRIGRAPDHNTAEWSLWLGRPLLSQWVWDVDRFLKVLAQAGAGPMHPALVGLGPAGLVALVTAALTTRVQKVAAVGTLASFVTDRPYEGQRLGTLVPGILKECGDIPQIAATISPRRLVLAGPVSPQNIGLDEATATRTFRPAAAAYQLEQASSEYRMQSDTSPSAVLQALA